MRWKGVSLCKTRSSVEASNFLVLRKELRNFEICVNTLIIKGNLTKREILLLMSMCEHTRHILFSSIMKQT